MSSKMTRTGYFVQVHSQLLEFVVKQAILTCQLCIKFPFEPDVHQALNHTHSTRLNPTNPFIHSILDHTKLAIKDPIAISVQQVSH